MAYERGTVVKGPDLFADYNYRPYVCLSDDTIRSTTKRRSTRQSRRRAVRSPSRSQMETSRPAASRETAT